MASSRDPVGSRPALARLLHHPGSVIGNALVGFWEKHQAGNAIAALKAKLAINAGSGVGDGKWSPRARRELVPGDVIRVRLGDIVPADAGCSRVTPFEVDQALTGESLPASRKPGEAVFSGWIIRQGEIGALVYATGANTYFGRTANFARGRHGEPFPVPRC